MPDPESTSDDTVESQNTLDPGQRPLEAPQAEHSSKSTGRVIRTRVIPAVAGLLVLGLIGVLIWALVAPESARTDPRRQINGAIVEENPDPAAGFTLARFDGQGDVSLSDYRGKVVILNFWASWCGPCIEEMPLLEQASNEFGEDVVVLGVNVWDDRSSAASFVESLGVSYPILDGGQDEIAVEYGVVGMPETYIVDPNGDVVAYFRGAFDSVQDLRDLIALARTE